ncbi:hypothetical protein AJ87_05630 [Rhizobium yanglingense]|nr:hypothetical protein AJ87_05630 [Rhizobium yanglingense]
MDQGIAVFDSSNQLTIWNRRFRQLLDLPEDVGRVGFPLSEIVAILSQRGDVPAAELSQTVRHFLTLDKPFSLVLGGGERIIEVRSNASRTRASWRPLPTLPSVLRPTRR